jgi:hypothetical protein
MPAVPKSAQYVKLRELVDRRNWRCGEIIVRVGWNANLTDKLKTAQCQTGLEAGDTLSKRLAYASSPSGATGFTETSVRLRLLILASTP